MGTEISWKWTDVFMRILTGCAVGLCAVGFVAPAYSLESNALNWMAFLVGLGLSAACAVCLLLSNSMAANAAVFFSHGKWGSGALAGVVFIGGGMVSMNSMHTGWTVFAHLVQGYPLPSDEQMGWAFGYVAFVKPAVNWGIQSLKEIKRSLETAERDREDRERDKREARMAAAEERRKAFQVVPQAAAAALIAGAGAIPASAETFPLEPVAHSAPASADAQAHETHGWKGPRDQAKWDALMGFIRQGFEPVVAFEKAGVRPSTGYRWLALANGNGKTEAA